MSTTRTRRRWVEVEDEVRRQARALPDVDRLNGSARRKLAPTLVVARRPVEPDTSVVPTRYVLPWADLAARRLAGEDVGPRVRVALRHLVRGRASTPGHVVALRDWLRTEIPAVLAQVDRDADELARRRVEAAAA